jgi:arabinose-5-phosphate isomerase
VDRIRLARDVIGQEARALEALAASLDDSFLRAVDWLAELEGRLVVSGVGKSGSIAQKVAGTLASTGTPASFLHPTDALHGDLGLVQSTDLLLTLSKSGRTDELIRFIGHFRRLGRGVISICEDPTSPVAELSDIVLEIPALGEAGPLALAPTTSAVLQLSLADALAMCLLDRRGFTADDFARYHPEGSLGRRLLLRCRDLMHQGDQLPIVGEGAVFSDLLLEIHGKGLGMACIVDGEGRFRGVFTDGDLRRLIARDTNLIDLAAGDALSQSRRGAAETPVERSMVREETLAVEALRMMKQQEITVLVVVGEDGSPRGVVRLQDLVKQGIESEAMGEGRS